MNITEVFFSLEKYLNEVQNDNFKTIINMYINKKEIFITPFLNVMDELFRNVIVLQSRGVKGDISYINYSILYSNILLEKNSLRIDIYDRNYVCDRVEVVGEWTPDYIFDNCRKDMDKAMRILSSDYIIMQEYEKKMLYDTYIVDFYFLAFFILKDMIPLIQTLDSYREMQKEENVNIIFGEYMDKGQTIYIFE